MKTEEILLKAIEKAIRNGYEFNIDSVFFDINGNLSTDLVWQTVVFSHEFAKHFWGEDWADSLAEDALVIWQYHLQQMVLEEEPIKYLEQFLVASPTNHTH